MIPGAPGVAGQTIKSSEMLEVHDPFFHGLSICVQPLATLFFANSSVACHNDHRGAREVLLAQHENSPNQKRKSKDIFMNMRILA